MATARVILALLTLLLAAARGAGPTLLQQRRHQQQQIQRPGSWEKPVLFGSRPGTSLASRGQLAAAGSAAHGALATSAADTHAMAAQGRVKEQEEEEPQGSMLGRSLLQVAPRRRVAWRGRFDPIYQLAYFAPHLVIATGPPEELKQVVSDPTTPGSRKPVLQVRYPAGSYSPLGTNPGGAIFYAYPRGAGVPIANVGATLEYDVYFPPDFPFAKGGKLPGLAGGPRACGGGTDPTSCWSVRVMWRTGGAGEAYLYVPEGHQGGDFCVQPPLTLCNYDAGVSLARGAFHFTAGAWHRLAITVRLNDLGQANGVVDISLNGQRVIYYDQLAYRLVPGIQVDSIYFSSFYGGSDPSWGPPYDTYLLFKNIQLFRLDPAPQAQATALGSVPEFKSQTVVKLQLQEPSD